MTNKRKIEMSDKVRIIGNRGCKELPMKGKKLSPEEQKFCEEQGFINGLDDVFLDMIGHVNYISDKFIPGETWISVHPFLQEPDCAYGWSFYPDDLELIDDGSAPKIKKFGFSPSLENPTTNEYLIKKYGKFLR